MGKRRFVILDALRGIAGLVVPLLHVCDPLAKRTVPIESIVGHGYLAVEFFLLLMGYMLGYAYDRRWKEGMRLGNFFHRRLVRLHPLVISGVILGLAVTFLQPEWGVWMWWFKDITPLKVTGIALWAATLVPVFGFYYINPFNACSWTLSYEYVGNILYGLIVRRMSKVMLLIGALVGAFIWLTFAFHVNLNHLFGTNIAIFNAAANYYIWSVAGGWSDVPVHFYDGFVRLLFPLFFGLLLFRLNWRIRLPKGAMWIAVGVFVAILFTPCEYRLGGPGNYWVNALFEAVATMVVFPILILIGVGNNVDDTTPVAKVCSFFAELSYPLYMSHYMFMAIYGWWVREHSNAFSTAEVIVIAGLVYLSLIVIAYLVMRFWDRPIQRWLAVRSQPAK